MTESDSYRTRRRVSRRAALRVAGLTAAGVTGAVLIGCTGEDPEPTSTPAASPTGGVAGPPPTPARPASTPTAVAIKRGGTYTAARSTDPPTINPYASSEDATKTVAAFAYNRLYKRETVAGSDGGDTRPTPDAAVAAVSDDGATWTVKLRDVELHDVPPVSGRKLDSEDVLFAFGLLKADESPNRAAVANWLRVEAPDPETVVFTLDAPSAGFLEQLADADLLQLVPREADGEFDPAVTMIGGGPWVFKEYEPSVRFRYDRHPNYYERGADGGALPYVDSFEYQIIPEYPKRLAQFLAGNLSELAINANDVIALRNEVPELQWLGEEQRLQSIFYWDNVLTTTAPYRDDRFRKAVSMSLDRDGLTDVGYGTFGLRDAGLQPRLSWNNIIPAGWRDRWWLDPQSAAHGDSAKFFEFNPVEATRLLRAQGVEEQFAIPYIYTSRYSGAFPRIAEAQIKMLQGIGLQPQPQVQSFSETYLPHTFQGGFTGMAFGYETLFSEAGSYWNRLFGDDAANHSRIVTPELTDITERQSVELDEDARRSIMHEGQIVNAENMFYVPSQAGTGTTYRAYQPSVRGGTRGTFGNGGGTEEYVWYWLDA